MTTRLVRLTVTILLGALAQAGCVAVPVLLPPVRVAIGGGAVAGQEFSEVTTMRIDTRPLQLLSEFQNRRHDGAIGYMEEHLGGVADRRSLVVTGGYLRYDHFPFKLDDLFGPQTGPLRVHVGATADLLRRSDNGDWGAGMSGVAGVEWAKWISGDFSVSEPDGGAVGSGMGEIGFGVEVQAAARFIPGMNYGLTTVSFTLRTPGILALVYALRSGR